jgi:hypothetical protein
MLFILFQLNVECEGCRTGFGSKPIRCSIISRRLCFDGPTSEVNAAALVGVKSDAFRNFSHSLVAVCHSCRSSKVSSIRVGFLRSILK